MKSRRRNDGVSLRLACELALIVLVLVAFEATVDASMYETEREDEIMIGIVCES